MPPSLLDRWFRTLAEADGKLPELDTVESPACHGASAALENGVLITTTGDATSRTGKITRDLDAIYVWEGPGQWQEAHPSLRVDGNTACASEPAKKSVYALDLDSGKKTASEALGTEPNEMAVTTK